MISFIMPVYNGVNYIQNAIDSIKKTVKTPFEIIVCDDKSIDGSARIISENAKADARVKHLRNSNRLGAGEARNKCIKHCSFDAICCLDCDNMVVDGVVDKMFAMLKDNVKVVATQKIGFFGFKDTNNHTPENYWDFTKYGEKVDLDVMLRTWEVPPCSGNYMYRREVFDAIEGYRTADVIETWGFGFRHIAKGFPVYLCPETMYLHRFCRKGYYLSLPKDAITWATYENLVSIKDKLSDESRRILKECAGVRDGSKLITEGRLKVR